MSTSENINITSACGNSNLTLTEVDLSPNDPSTSGVTDTSYLCDEILNASTGLDLTTCGTGNYPGVQIYRYEGTTTLAPCADWQFTWSSCCRNPAYSYPGQNGCNQNYPNAFTRTQNPSSLGQAFVATMNNADGLCNSSPDFRFSPRAFICQGQQIILNNSGIDPDGDSISYELVAPLDNITTPITYNAGYSFNNPISVVQGTTFGIDAQTGIIEIYPKNFGVSCPNPDSLEQSSMAVQVNQFRNGNLVGTTIRDIQIVTLPGCDPLDATDFGVTNIGGNTNVIQATDPDQPDTIRVCAGDSLDFEVLVIDGTNLDSFKLNTTLRQYIPETVFTYDTFGAINQMKGRLQLLTTFDHVGQYLFDIEAENTGCPVTITQLFRYVLEIIPSTIAIVTPDTTCFNSDSVIFEASGGNNFNWFKLDASPANLDCDNCETTFASPQNTETYMVWSDLEALYPGEGCRDKDTVTLVVVPPVKILGDTSICVDDTSIFTIGWDWPGDNLDSIVWNRDELLTDTFLLGLTEGIYVLSVYDTLDMTENLVCLLEDSVELAVVNCPVSIPNIFTPNGDGDNDIFFIDNIKRQAWNLTIYSRWGREVLVEKFDYQNDWDGGSLNDGTYYYTLTNQDGSILTEYKGWFQIAR